MTCDLLPVNLNACEQALVTGQKLSCTCVDFCCTTPIPSFTAFNALPLFQLNLHKRPDVKAFTIINSPGSHQQQIQIGFVWKSAANVDWTKVKERESGAWFIFNHDLYSFWSLYLALRWLWRHLNVAKLSAH